MHNFKTSLIVAALILLSTQAHGQLAKTDSEKIAGHTKITDQNGQLLAWYKPDIEGAAFSHVAKLASEFMKVVPIDPESGLPWYYITCCFQGPHMTSQEDFDKGTAWEKWMHNPACVFAGMVQSLVLDYRVFSGDESYIALVGEMLDYQLENGTTPADWPWPNVPYASSDPGDIVYEGAKGWETDGMRGDGLHGIEPDKVGELGIAYLKYYEVTGRDKYLDAAIYCANALAKHVRDVVGDPGPFSGAQTSRSPWPFRVNARNGIVIDEYCSNVIEPIRLFDELIRLNDRIELDTSLINYQKARKLAWDWLYSKNGPMKTGVWNAYFEDIPNDPGRTNRVQITPMETARYLIKNPEMDPNLKYTIPSLLSWVASAFGTEGMDAIKEQTWCYEPMGSHTARYASICALWYEYTGDEKYKDEARRYFNLATYMTDPNGVVRVGPNWPSSWFSDGYGDYIRHFMEGIAAVPEWSPADENHLLKSSTAIREIHYESDNISYITYDATSQEVLRLAKKPKKIMVDSERLSENSKKENFYQWTDLNKGGILRINTATGNKVDIAF
jgi:hypothetical protein